MELSSTPARAALAAFGGKRIELMAVAINKETIEFDALCYNAEDVTMAQARTG
jgi:hypothetical protein